MVEALYGNSGIEGHWERHLQQVLVEYGAVPVQNYPSSSWFEKDRLFLTIYVDDLLRSGPATTHDPLGKKVGRLVNLDPPDDLFS